MNPTLEPREVERPFIGRWLRTSLALIVRSPVQFGLLIVLLVCFDNAIVDVAGGLRVAKLWSNAFGALLLGLIWVFIAALARGADDASRVWSALAQLLRVRVWAGALVSTAGAAAFNFVVGWVLDGATGLHYSKSVPFPQHPGDVVAAIARNAAIFTVFFEPFYFPLLALIPDIPPRLARSLSMSAGRKNGTVAILLGVGIVVVAAAALAEIVPLFGLTEALAVVFVGVFNYVAYRDVFERRDTNVPQAVKKAPEILSRPEPSRTA